jgi:membrane associated rhomboid family serine protease
VKRIPPSFEAIHLRDTLVREEVLENFRISMRPWPPVAMALVVGIVLIHLAAVQMSGDLTPYAVIDPYTLQQTFYPEWQGALMVFGARAPYEITELHQYYRLLSCVFLHSDGMHLALNMIALFGLGRLCEAVYGAARFLWLFVFAGLCGSAASMTGEASIAVGASGSVFGLLGAGVVFGLRYKSELPRPLKRIFGRGLIPWVLLNIVIGLNVPQIDNLGHMGGLFGGAILALWMGNRVIRDEQGHPRNEQWMLAVSVGLVVYTLLRMGQSIQTYL